MCWCSIHFLQHEVGGDDRWQLSAASVFKSQSLAFVSHSRLNVRYNLLMLNLPGDIWGFVCFISFGQITVAETEGNLHNWLIWLLSNVLLQHCQYVLKIFCSSLINKCLILVPDYSELKLMLKCCCGLPNLVLTPEWTNNKYESTKLAYVIMRNIRWVSLCSPLKMVPAQVPLFRPRGHNLRQTFYVYYV